VSIPHHPLIDAWYQEELATGHYQRDDAGVVMGFPLWGEAYVQRFLNYMLPSMMAPPNHKALDAARWELVLYVDRQTAQSLEAVSALWNRPIGWRLLPDDLADLLHRSPEWKYSLMSAVHNLLIHQAAQKGAGFGMAVSDIVYSSRYFERLLALGQTHDVIVHQALIVSEKAAAYELDALAWEGTLEISAQELGTLGWWRVCGLMKSWNMNDIEDPSEGVPGTHFVLWRGQNSIRMHCPHLTPVWLSNKACREVPTDISDTLDARFLGDAYMPTLDDDMTLITIDNSRDAPADKATFDLFRHNLLAHFAACMSQFKVPCMVPTLPATDGFLPDDVIEQRFQKLCGLLGV
jgi:hypothetical protein